MDHETARQSKGPGGNPCFIFMESMGRELVVKRGFCSVLSTKCQVPGKKSFRLSLSPSPGRSPSPGKTANTKEKVQVQV